MKKYLRNITVGTALALVAGSCTGNFAVSYTHLTLPTNSRV